ncbi:MAG: 4-hydroxy-tetrahydrodipicolinate synthase [Bacteroidota bacterium]
MDSFQGTGVALVTPFRADLSLDLEALRGIVTRQIDGGTEYLVVLGTTGETATLSEAEQARVIETVLEANDKRLPIVLGAGGNDTAKVCKQVELVSKRYQPDAILSVSPYYNKPSQEGIYQHYKAVAASTDADVILYNVPPRTASNITAETSLRLAHDIPNIKALKEASGDFDQFWEILRQKPDDFALLSGDDPLTLPMISLGAVGVISVSANALPAAYSQMTRAALAGDLQLSQRLMYQLKPLIDLNFAEGNPAGVKMMMECLGICRSEVRLPLVQGSGKLREAMQTVLRVGSLA